MSDEEIDEMLSELNYLHMANYPGHTNQLMLYQSLHEKIDEVNNRISNLSKKIYERVVKIEDRINSVELDLEEMKKEKENK